MTTARATDTHIADMQGGDALPRRNGELVFHDEWERRVFAMAVALHEQGCFQWDDFRTHLIDEIAATGEMAAQPDPAAPGYFEHWLTSFERVLADKGISLPNMGGTPAGDSQVAADPMEER